jgi:hypothetical protein
MSGLTEFKPEEREIGRTSQWAGTTHQAEEKPCSCAQAGTGCVIKGKGISAPAGCYCIAGWEGWRY